MKEFLRVCIIFTLLISIPIIYLGGMVMLYGFLGWLVIINWNIYLPVLSFQNVESSAFLVGVIGAICFIATDSHTRVEIGESLRRAIRFVNRLLPLEKKKEVGDGKR